VPFSRIAETRIREAMAQGEFENLPGAGKPLNLEDYFSTPEDLRMAFSIVKNANCAPAEVELLNEVSRLQQAVAEAGDAATKQQLRSALVDRQTQLAIALERRSRERSF
jgi:DnaJ homologue, subfamily C, member 28, conserved domain